MTTEVRGGDLGEPKRSDEFRKQIEEEHPQLQKRFEEMTEEEKGDLMVLFNNFYNKVPYGQIYDIDQETTEKLDVPVKEAYGWDSERLAKLLNRGDYSLSEKFVNGSLKQFYTDIRLAIMNSGVDIDDFENKSKRLSELRSKRYDREEKLTKEEALEEPELMAWINFTVIPAVMDLIDSGYNRSDLTQ